MNFIARILQPIPPLARPLVVAGVLACASYFLERAINPAPKRNPRRNRTPDVWGDPDDPRVEQAADFREKFHWGNPTRSIRKRAVPKPPEVAVKLGTLEGVIYRTNKRGDGMTSYVHEFEGRKPSLLMDIDNKKLHIAGGSYGVIDDGIIG